MSSDAPTPDPATTVDSAAQDAEEVLHPQDSRVVRDIHGNPLPGTDDPGRDTVSRSG
jgi:hypothetical protein